MNMIDYLIVEHRVMLEWLTCLEMLLEGEPSLKSNSIKDQLTCFIRVLNKHSVIEDKFLFPEVNQILRDDHCEPIKVFEFEHQEIEKIIQLLQSSQNQRIIRVQSMKLISFLRDHFAKEESVLFPLIIKHVEPARLAAMLKESCLLDKACHV